MINLLFVHQVHSRTKWDLFVSEISLLVKCSNPLEKKLQRHRMVVVCQPYAPAAFTPQEMILVLISVRG